eukprot:SAG11_NODE_2395_length_3406_cov_9.604475_3_plen_79_part_00
MLYHPQYLLQRVPTDLTLAWHAAVVHEMHEAAVLVVCLRGHRVDDERNGGAVRGAPQLIRAPHARCRHVDKDPEEDEQ